MSQFVCDGTCAGNEFGDCNHGESNDGLPRVGATKDELEKKAAAWIVDAAALPGGTRTLSLLTLLVDVYEAGRMQGQQEIIDHPLAPRVKR